MSRVANVILVTMPNDGSVEDEIPTPNANILCTKYGLVQVDSYAGGNKSMECDVFLAAVNFLNVDEIIRDFRSISWGWPRSAELMIRDEDDDRFTVYHIL